MMIKYNINLFKRLILCFLFILVILNTSIVSCVSDPSNTNLNINKNIKHETIISGWFKPSGPGSSHYEYKWYWKNWINQCPNPKCKGNLICNPKNSPESELTCSHCGADYCGVTGNEKRFYPRWKLKSNNETS